MAQLSGVNFINVLRKALMLVDPESQGCIFWPLSPPARGGENRHFWKSGEENRPQREKNSIVKKKFEFYKQMFFFLLQLQLY